MLRATPLVTLLLLLFFALPISACRLIRFRRRFLALVMNTSAFNCEVWRSALMNFPKDQYEAAQSVACGPGNLSSDRLATDRARESSGPRQ